MPPHESWAQWYDFVYEQSFGTFYEQLTQLTLSTVRDLCPAPARLLDAGAGTGRLSIPLAAQGYEVDAMDASEAMLDVLNGKAEIARVRVNRRVARLQDCVLPPEFNLVLCVFTTVSYLTDETALAAAVRNLAGALVPGGKLLIDIPDRAVFQSHDRITPVLERRVSVDQLDTDLYRYHERTRCFDGGLWQGFEDEFVIRYWPVGLVTHLLAQHGVTCSGPLDVFRSTLSNYCVGTKA